MNDDSQIGQEETDIKDILKAAFPGDIQDKHYFAMLLILSEHLSQRAIADAVSSIDGKDYGLSYNDVLGVQSLKTTPSHIEVLEADMLATLKILNACGFQQWLKELEDELESYKREGHRIL